MKILQIDNPYLLFAVFRGGSKIVTYNFGWGGWGGLKIVTYNFWPPNLGVGGGCHNCNLQFLTPKFGGGGGALSAQGVGQGGG